MRLKLIAGAHPFLINDLAILQDHDAMHVLLFFLHGLQVFFHRFVQLRGSLSSRQLLCKIVIVDEPDALFFDGLLYFRTLEQVGHSLTVFSDGLISDMPYFRHFGIIVCRMVEEYVSLAFFEFVEHLDEARLLFLQCAVRPAISYSLERVSLHRVRTVHRRKTVFFRKLGDDSCDFRAEAA